MDASKIAMLAETEGPPGVSRWVREHSQVLSNDDELLDSLYFQLKVESPGGALLFALVLQKGGLVSPRLATELQDAKNANAHLWVCGVCHLRMPAILEKVRTALDAGDVLFGWHGLYCGGGSPDLPVFTSFRDFEETLERATPGDYFQLASVRQLAVRGSLLEPTLAAARNYLAACPSGEVWVLRTGDRPPRIEILCSGDEDEVAESWFSPGDGLIVARTREDLEFDDEYFLDAKKPDAHGAVPLGGAY